MPCTFDIFLGARLYFGSKRDPKNAFTISTIVDKGPRFATFAARGTFLTGAAGVIKLCVVPFFLRGASAFFREGAGARHEPPRTNRELLSKARVGTSKKTSQSSLEEGTIAARLELSSTKNGGGYNPSW